jgi:hypothetical protein
LAQAPPINVARSASLICTVTAKLEGIDEPLTVGGQETSSVMQIIAPLTEADGAESDLSCAFDSSGADICTVIAKLEEVDEPLAAGGLETASVMQIIAAVADANGTESELSCVFDSAGADICTITAKIEEVYAIVVEVSQSATVADSGPELGNREEPQHTGSILEPAAAEPPAMLDSRKD